MNTIGHNVYEGIVPSSLNNVNGWHSWSPVFNKLIEEVKPNIIVEVGTWLGASAINMANITKQLGLNTKIYCIDTWLGAQEFWTWGKSSPERDLKLKNGYPKIYFDFLTNVVSHNVQDVITPIPTTSTIGSHILQHYNIKADLIYIDGSHEYIDVKNDIEHYLNILTLNGVMFGDDMDGNWPGLSRAVHETLGNKFEISENNFWVYRK